MLRGAEVSGWRKKSRLLSGAAAVWLTNRTKEICIIKWNNIVIDREKETLDLNKTNDLIEKKLFTINNINIDNINPIKTFLCRTGKYIFKDN